MGISKNPAPEGATPILDISDLKVKNIPTQEELFILEYDACTNVTVDYLSGNKKLKEFSRGSLFAIHKEMFFDIWKWGGKKRTYNTNIGINHYQIEEQLKVLLDDLKDWESKKEPPLEIAVRLHHRLVLIHPFPNGNGRWARMISNIYLHQKTGKLFYWPEKEVGKNSDFRKNYLKTLQEADHLNYQPLLDLHKNLLA